MKRCAFNHLRWITNAFCLFSLLVFVSSVTIWVRSCFAHDRLECSQPTSNGVISYHLFVPRGHLLVSRSRLEFGPSHTLSVTRTAPLQLHDHRFGDFELRYEVDPLGPGWRSIVSVIIPFWLFLPAAVPPFLWWRKWRKKGGRGFPVVVASSTSRE